MMNTVLVSRVLPPKAEASVYCRLKKGFCKEQSPLECKGLCSLQCDQTWTTISRPVNRKYGEAYMRGQSKVEVDTSGSLSGPTPPVAFCTSGQQPLVSIQKGQKHDRRCRPARSRESEPQEWLSDRAQASPPRSATPEPPALAEKKFPRHYHRQFE